MAGKYIWVMSYGKEPDALAKINELKEKGYKTRLTVTHDRGRFITTLYNVWVIKQGG